MKFCRGSDGGHIGPGIGSISFRLTRPQRVQVPKYRGIGPQTPYLKHLLVPYTIAFRYLDPVALSGSPEGCTSGDAPDIPKHLDSGTYVEVVLAVSIERGPQNGPQYGSQKGPSICGNSR